MKIRVIIPFLFIFFMLFAVMPGCSLLNEKTSVDEEPPVVLIILAGNHANSQKFDFQPDSTVQRVCTSFGNIGIIIVDGNPALLYDEDTKEIVGCSSIEHLEKSKKNYKKNGTTWKKNYLQPQIECISSKLDESVADDSEVDTLRALQVAAEALSTIEASMETDVKKEILVLDTGLCTSGSLSFLQPDVLALLKNERKIWEDEIAIEKVSQMVNALDAAAEIPDLSGVTITWYGLGKTVDPQPPLTNLDIQNLQYLWSEILKAAGTVPSESTATDSKYGIFVTTSASGSISSKQFVTPVIQWEEDMPILTEETLGFIRNSAKFRSEEQVDEVLHPYAENLKNYPDMDILLVGTTASYDGGSVSLSEDRARKVREKLVSFGVPEERIGIVGLGYNLEFCQDDTPNGEFIEEIAKENRAVRILPYNSKKAQNALKYSTASQPYD